MDASTLRGDARFTLDDFTVDLDAGTVTCPEEITVTITAARAARFGAHCHTCPVRHMCTNANSGRVIWASPRIVEGC